MDAQIQQLMRRVPSVDAVLQEPALEALAAEYGRKPVADAVRAAVEAGPAAAFGPARVRFGRAGAPRPALWPPPRSRSKLSCGRITAGRSTRPGSFCTPAWAGRSCPAKALDQIQQTLQSYSLIQVDRETGKRSRRDERIEWLLQRLTGAEAATVVNNNAAATAIVLNSVAKGKEVIVSRGQLVEIGGSFRLPEVMAFSGAKLVEVGTTNKTHPRDYENAVTENTAAILRVHPSNYKIQGFSAEVPLDEMVAIAHKHNLVMIDDVGAGALIDFSQFGFEPEPLLADSIRQGADIVTCSADKLIGASQGGLILGKKALIDAVRKNQFARIVRVGKLTLAVLEATLKLFLDESVALREVPTLQMLRRSAEEIREHAERLAAQIRDKNVAATVTTASGFSEMGSGSLPTQNLATTLVAITPEKISVDVLAKRLRLYEPPVFARIQNDQVLLDPRTLRAGDDEIVTQAVVAALAASE